MGKSYWLKDEDQKGNFTNDKKDTFDPKKRYIGVRLQQGVPLLDRDWNELEDIRRYEMMTTRKEYIGNGSPDDGFKISACGSSDDFNIGKGSFLIDGFEVVNDSEISYKGQNIKDASTPESNTSSSDSRIDHVYLDVWVDEVNKEEDPDLGNPTDLNEETTIRHKVNWCIKVSEDPYLQPADFHKNYRLAKINRTSGNTVISDKDIEDLREERGKDKFTVKSLTFKNDQTPKEWPKMTCEAANQVNFSGDLIIPNGKIGIGTTLPSEKLEVKGAVKASNNGQSLILRSSKEDEERAMVLDFMTSSGNVDNSTASTASIQAINAENSSSHLAFFTFELEVSPEEKFPPEAQPEFPPEVPPEEEVVSDVMKEDKIQPEIPIEERVLPVSPTSPTLRPLNSMVERLRITNNGNVGIGTANPFAKLEVNGNIKGKANLIIDGNVGFGTTDIKRQLHVEGNSEIHSGGSGAGFSFANRKTNSFVDSPTKGERWVWYSDRNPGIASLWSGKDLMSIDKDGNVGIGTTSPSTKLEIAGDVILRGQIIQDNWNSVTLLNGWEEFGGEYNLPGYFLDKNGIVHLRGLVLNGKINQDSPIFTLPKGYRPANRELHFVVCIDNNNNSDGFGRCDIRANGEVIAMSRSKPVFSLDGITFRASGGKTLTSAVFGEKKNIYYLGGDNHIYELASNGTNWVFLDLMKQEGASDAVGSEITTVVIKDGMSVFYLGNNNHVYELAYRDKKWIWRDLMKDATPQGQPAAERSALTSAVNVDGKQSVFYLGTDSHVYELAYNGTNWVSLDLTTAGKGQPAATGSALTTVVIKDGTSVFYLGTDSHVYELAHRGSSIVHVDLTTVAKGQLAAAGGELISAVNIDGKQSVFYLGADRHVYELAYNGTNWVSLDLTTAGKGQPAATGSALTTVVIKDGTSVFYLGTDSHVYELAHRGSSIVHVDLTTVAKGQLAAAGGELTSAVFNGKQNVYYLGVDNYIYGLEYDGTNWVSRKMPVDIYAKLMEYHCAYDAAKLIKRFIPDVTCEVLTVELKSAGYELNDIVTALIKVGYGIHVVAPVLSKAGYSANEIANAIALALKAVGYSPNDIVSSLKAVGYSPNDIASSLRNAGYSPVDIALALVNAGYSPVDIALALVNAGYKDVEVANAIASALRKAGYNVDKVAKFMKDSIPGITGEVLAGALKGAGCALEEIGKTLTDLYGYEPKVLEGVLNNVGYTGEQIGNAFKEMGGNFADFGKDLIDKILPWN